jgi:hypothetical protein
VDCRLTDCLCLVYVDRRTTFRERFEEKSAVICGKYCGCVCFGTDTTYSHVMCAYSVELLTFKFGGVHNNHWV